MRYLSVPATYEFERPRSLAACRGSTGEYVLPIFIEVCFEALLASAAAALKKDDSALELEATLFLF